MTSNKDAGWLHHLYRHLIMYWLVLIVPMLAGGLYLHKTYLEKKSQTLLAQDARRISQLTDDFIEDVMQEVYAMPAFKTTLPECHKLIPLLDKISNHSPKISGMLVADTQSRQRCSNIPYYDNLFHAKSDARSISGPWSIPGFNQPVFEISQTMGRYQLGLLVLASLIEHEVSSPKTVADAISLYHAPDHKSLVSINKGMQEQVPAHVMTAADSLNSITDVVVSVGQTQMMYQLWINQLIMLSVLLTLAIGMFFLIKRTLAFHYSLRNAIKQAIKHQRFYPVYQPIYDQMHQRYCGAEVLLRWNDFNDDIVMPDHFIDEAEQSGLIVPITLQIIDKALKETQPLYAENPHFHLSFNLSALHFTHHDFFSRFFELVNKHAIPPKQVVLEITERELLDKNNQVFISTMRKLIDLGYSLAIDDYGTGHASISYIQNFPFNYLKIDQIFVQAIGTKAINESLIDTIISMAKNLNLAIIAEGVETPEQVAYLIRNNVPFLQGWYFSKAVNGQTLKQILGEDDHDEGIP